MEGYPITQQAEQEGLRTLASGFSESDRVRRLQQMTEKAFAAAPLLADPLARLVAMQNKASRSYYRLAEAERSLRRRTRGTAGDAGRIATKSMEVERRRVGRELHTGVGQSLAGIRVHISLIEDALADPPEAVRRSLDRILNLTESALEQVRGVSRGLYVPVWQTQPLVDALRELWEGSGIPEQFCASLDLEEPHAEPPMEVRHALYLVAQEGISNVIQHSSARRVRLSLREEEGRIRLEVEDDGSGLPPVAEAEQPALSTGIGLRSMRDLARELGGEFAAYSGPEGARLSVSFPVSS